MKCEHLAKLLKWEQSFPLTKIGLKLLGFKPFEEKICQNEIFYIPVTVTHYIKIGEGLVHTEDGSAQSTSALQARRVQPIPVHFSAEHRVVNQCQREAVIIAWEVHLVLLQEKSVCQALQQMLCAGGIEGFLCPL